MELTIKIKDKKVYEEVMTFLKSLKAKVEIKSIEDKDNEQWNKLAQEQFLKGYHSIDSIYDTE